MGAASPLGRGSPDSKVVRWKYGVWEAHVRMPPSKLKPEPPPALSATVGHLSVFVAPVQIHLARCYRTGRGCNAAPLRRPRTGGSGAARGVRGAIRSLRHPPRTVSRREARGLL